MTSDPHARITVLIVWLVGILTALLILGAFALLAAGRPVPEWCAMSVATGLGGLLAYLSPRPPAPPLSPAPAGLPATLAAPDSSPDGGN